MSDGQGGFRFSRQVNAEQLETIVAIGFDEVERACVLGERFKAQSEGGLSRFGHPEKRIGFNALRAFQGIFLTVGLQVRFGTDFNPVVRTEIGVRVEHCSRVAQFHLRNVERHGVGRLDEGVFYASGSGRVCCGGQPCGGGQCQ